MQAEGFFKARVVSLPLIGHYNWQFIPPASTAHQSAARLVLSLSSLPSTVGERVQPLLCLSGIRQRKGPDCLLFAQSRVVWLSKSVVWTAGRREEG